MKKYDTRLIISIILIVYAILYFVRLSLQGCKLK